MVTGRLSCHLILLYDLEFWKKEAGICCKEDEFYANAEVYRIGGWIGWCFTLPRQAKICTNLRNVKPSRAWRDEKRGSGITDIGRQQAINGTCKTLWAWKL